MINLTISADSAEALLQQLLAISMSLGLGVAPTEDDGPTAEEKEIAAQLVKNAAPQPVKTNGADVVEMPKRTRAKKAPAAEPEAAKPEPVDRQAIIKGLTDIYMTAAPGVRDAITAFRDSHGVQRLRELKDDAIPAAAALLDNLQKEDAGAP
jgi:hypothetical protein